MSIELESFRTKVRAFAESEIAPHAAKIDRDDEFPADMWKKIGDAKLMGITIPKAYGGEELSYFHHVIAVEELSRASGSAGFAYAANSNICIDNLYKHANEEQRKKYLPKLISGEHVGALAMSEPDAGSDVIGSMSCFAEKKGNNWVANGTKRWITNGPYANTLIVYMRTAAKETGSKSITAFIIEKGMPGFTQGTKKDKLGMRGAGNCELYFENCEIPDSQVLGEVNQGVKLLMNGLDSERLILCGGPLGIMQAALDVVIPYCQEREQFGQAIGNFQMVQAKIAEMYTRMEASRAMVYRLGANFKDHPNRNRDAAAACLFSSESSTSVSLDAIQLLGGRGYMNEEIPGRLLRDSKIYEIGGGTNEIRKMIIARDLLSRKK
ncbi:MAG: acyl-CoA dehydrogenase family protein [Gammaproteobacteria bacterium]|nr:acyl-CoA dehydrogenase family protein [Gammaproteobacteria bacterium]